jgi:hypothetical protein
MRDNIKIDLRQKGPHGVDSVHLTQWRNIANTVINLVLGFVSLLVALCEDMSPGEMRAWPGKPSSSLQQCAWNETPIYYLYSNLLCHVYTTSSSGPTNPRSVLPYICLCTLFQYVDTAKCVTPDGRAPVSVRSVLHPSLALMELSLWSVISLSTIIA